MKTSQILVLVGLSGVCLLSAYGLMSLGKSTMRVQTEVKDQQRTIDRMARIYEPAKLLLQEIGGMSLTNTPMQALLARHGYTVRIASDNQTPARPPNAGPTAAAK